MQCIGGVNSNKSQKMNSTIASTNLFLAAAASFPILLVSPVAACLIATLAGVLSLLVLDYGRPVGPVALSARIVPFEPTCCAPAVFRDAA